MDLGEGEEGEGLTREASNGVLETEAEELQSEEPEPPQPDEGEPEPDPAVAEDGTFAFEEDAGESELPEAEAEVAEVPGPTGLEEVEEEADEEAELEEEPEETYEYTDQQVRDIRAAFRKYDEVLNDTIPTSRLGHVLRALGLNPTDAELRSAARWLDTDLVRGVVRFKEFLIILGRSLKDPITEQTVLEAFQSMDEQRTGTVSRAALHDVLTTAGERLYPLEFAAFIKYADPKRKGVVKYEDFVKKMNSGKLDKKKKRGKKKKGKKKKKKKGKAKRAPGEDTSSSGSSCGELSV